MGFWLGWDMNTQYPILQCDNHTMYIPQTFSFSFWTSTSRASPIPFPVTAPKDLRLSPPALSGCCRRTGPVARAPRAPVTCIPSRQPQNDLGIGCLRAWASPFPEASELRGGQCGAPRPKDPSGFPAESQARLGVGYRYVTARNCPRSQARTDIRQRFGLGWVSGPSPSPLAAMGVCHKGKLSVYGCVVDQFLLVLRVEWKCGLAEQAEG
jgi:hypothetical protein